MDWLNFFSESEKLFNDIFELVKEDDFRKSQNVKVFALTSLLICRENLSSINVLLNNDLYYELFMIFRHQIELMFRLHWLLETSDEDERKKRTNKIEADSLRNYQAELNGLKQMKERTFFDDELLDESQKMLDNVKENNPSLVENNLFMRCENNIEMAGDLREKYYHQYRFLSMLSHPNPLSRDYFLTTDGKDDFFQHSFYESCKYTAKVLKENLNKIIILFGDELTKLKEIKELQEEFNDVVGE